MEINPSADIVQNVPAKEIPREPLPPAAPATQTPHPEEQRPVDDGLGAVVDILA